MNISFHPRYSKRIKRILFAGILLSSGIIVAVFFNYRHNLNISGNLLSSISEDVDVSLERIHQTATRNGITEWNLEADSAQYLEKEKSAVFTNPLITFFLKNKGKVFLKAKRGKLLTEVKDIEVTDDVVMQHTDYKLVTNNLQYESERHIIYTEAPVSISSDTFFLRADTMTFDLDSNKTIFKGRVEGTFVEPEPIES